MRFQQLSKVLSIAFLAFFTLVSLNAQSDPAEKKAKMTPSKTVKTDEAREDEAFAKDLNLTKKQKAEFKKANEQYKAKSKAIKNVKKEDLQRLREERIRAHKAALSPEQLKKYDEVLAKREAKHKEKHARKSEEKAGRKATKKENRKEGKKEKKDPKGEKESEKEAPGRQ